ncbi:MAG: PspC domain-containing protein [Proteobacteria bacterium]|nr:PspC domain-containing protein [Pseudomonadota bacterium]
MRQVITINLNNNAYQVEDEGYAALRDYMATAERRLADYPDRQEILADLEQAIADKCDSFLGAHKNVITTAEVSQILREMGPVAGSDDEATRPQGNPSTDTPEQGFTTATGPRQQPRRLYRLAEGKLLGGVCTGLAAYFGIDVVWVRALWVLMTLFTGVWLLVYVAALFIVPKAETPAERAQAHGTPFNAQDLIDRAREHYASARHSYSQYRSQSGQAKWTSKQSARRWRSQFRQRMTDAMPPPSTAARLVGTVLLPFFAIVSAALFVAVALALALVVTDFNLQSWGVPALNLPTWVQALVLLLAYAVIALPVGAGRRMALYYANGGSRFGWADMWSGVIWLASAALLLWALTLALPELRQLLEQLMIYLRVEASSAAIDL